MNNDEKKAKKNIVCCDKSKRLFHVPNLSDFVIFIFNILYGSDIQNIYSILFYYKERKKKEATIFVSCLR